MRLLKILGALMLACFIVSSVLTRESYVQAQYSSATPIILPSGTPFPTARACKPPCDSMCAACVDDNPDDGLAVTCTPFCNYNANDGQGECAFTCSTYQSTCSSWGEWDECVDGWQHRVCDTNDNLGQIRPCSVDPVNTPGDIEIPPQSTIPPTPTPTIPPSGTIRARAVAVDRSDTSCAAVRAVSESAGEIDGTILEFTPSSASRPAAQTQPGASYVTFSPVVAGSYTLAPNPPTADWAFARSC